jgi:hypothetical protein
MHCPAKTASMLGQLQSIINGFTSVSRIGAANVPVIPLVYNELYREILAPIVVTILGSL